MTINSDSVTIQNVWRGVAGGDAGDGGQAYSTGKKWFGGSSYSINGGNGGTGGSLLLKITDSIVTINGLESDAAFGLGGAAGEGKKAGTAGKDGTAVSTFIGEKNDVVTLGGGFKGTVTIDDGSLYTLNQGTASYINSKTETVYPMTFRVIECPGVDPVTKLSGVRIESGEYAAYSRTSTRLDSPDQATFGWATVWLPATSAFLFTLDDYEDTEAIDILINSEQDVMMCPLGTVTFYADPGNVTVSGEDGDVDSDTYAMKASHGKVFSDPFDGENVILNPPAGYTYNGWYEKVNGVLKETSWNFESDLMPHGNLDLYADNYVSSKFTVTYHPGTGTGTEKVYDEDLDAIHAVLTHDHADLGFSKDGHTFSHWEDDSENPVTYSATESFPVTRNSVLTAQWTPISYYTVTYKDSEAYDAATFIDDNLASIGGVPYDYTVRGWVGDDPENPDPDGVPFTKTGYTLTHWYNEANPAEIYEFGDDAALLSDLTLIAAWQASDCYYVNYYGGEYGIPITLPYTDGNLVYGELYEVLDFKDTNLTNSSVGHEFAYWLDNDVPDTKWYPGDTFTVEGYKNLTAVWVAKEYTVTWNYLNTADAAQTDETETYNYGATPIAPVNAVSFVFEGKNYELTGWEPTVVTVTGDAEYTAQYDITDVDYNVVWNYLNTADAAQTAETETYNYGATPIAPVNAVSFIFEGKNYELTGWEPTIVTVTGDAEYTAQYDITDVDYNVVWNYLNTADAAQTAETETYNYGATPIAPVNAVSFVFEGKNYELTGWEPTIVTVTGDAEYTAQYDITDVDYNVVWNYLNTADAAQTAETETYNYGATPIAPVNAVSFIFEGKNYELTGWEPTIVTVTGDAEYTAQYDITDVDYNVVWNYLNTADAAQTAETETYNYGATPIAPVNAVSFIFEGKNYELTGWEPTIVTVTGDAEYTAQYDITDVDYNVVWNYLNTADAAQTAETETYNYGATPIAPVNAVSFVFEGKNYELTGWEPTIVTVTGDAEYTAQYEITDVDYNVVWNYLNTADATQTAETETYNYGATPIAPVNAVSFVFEGKNYELTGWEPTIVTVTGDAEYTAQYDITDVDYNVVWNYLNTADAAQTAETETYNYGATPIAPVNAVSFVFEGKNYELTGWEPTIVTVTGDAEYTAQYDITDVDYNVVWNYLNTADATQTAETETYNYGATPIAPVNAVSFVFEGKNYELTGWEPAIVTVTGDAEYTAQYDITDVDYNVVWNYLNTADATQTAETETYNYGATPIAPVNAVSFVFEGKNYELTGWEPTIVTVTGDAEYTAQYDITDVDYNVVWNYLNTADAAQTAETETYNYGATPIAPINAVSFIFEGKNYELTGWEPTIVTVTGDAEYTAQYDITDVDYNVVWNYLNTADATQTAETETYNYGATPIAPVNAVSFTFEGKNYELTGWEPTIVTVTGDAEYTAQYDITDVDYNVVWNYLSTADATQTDETETYNYGATPIAPVNAVSFVFEGKNYELTGWEPAIVTVTGDAEYTAQYDITDVDYNVVWNYLNTADAAQTAETETYNYGATPIAPVNAVSFVFEGKNYELTGWEPTIVTVTGDAEYTAQYDITDVDYNVVWNYLNTADAAQTAETETYNYGATPIAPVNAVSFTFEGKNYELTGWEPTIVTVTGDAEYTAQYDITDVDYNVVWNYLNTADAAQTAETETYNYGATPIAPVNAVSFVFEGKNYELTGWEPTIVTVTGDAEYTAQYEITDVDYNVVWNYLNTADAAQTAETETYNYGATPIAPVNAVSFVFEGKNYELTGWEPTIVTVTGDAEYTAQYDITDVDYNVVWNYLNTADAAQTAETETYNYGATPIAPVNAVSFVFEGKNYELTGWEPAIVTVTGDAEYTAQYDITDVDYNVVWNYLNTADAAQTAETETYNYGATPIAPVNAVSFVFEGKNYELTGWEPAIVTVTGDAEYTAQYDITDVDYNVVWNYLNTADAAQTAETETYNYGATPIAPADAVSFVFEGKNYELTGWEPTIVTVTGDAEYTAQYDITALLTVTYRSGDGNGNDVTYYESVDATHAVLAHDDEAIGFSKDGHEFHCWNIEGIEHPTGTCQPEEELQVADHVTLTAMWVADTFTVTYTAGEGGLGGPTVIQETNGAEHTVLTADDVSISKPGHKLIHWEVAAVERSVAVGDTFIPDDTFTVENDVTLTAVWEAEKYTVTYKAGDGGVGGPYVVDGFTYGDGHNIITNETAGISKPGYNFSYWMNEDTSDTKKYRSPELITITENLTLVAFWEAGNCYTVTYYPGDGTYEGGNSFTDPGLYTDSDYTIRNPNSIPFEAPENHVFDYWLKVENPQPADPTTYQPGDEITITDYVHLKAVWKLASDSFTVTYKSGDNGNGADFMETVYYDDEAYTVLGPYNDLVRFTPADEGCSFNYWLASDGVTKYYPDQILTIGEQLTGDETLTAFWSTDCVSVTYLSGDHGKGWYADKTPVVGEPYTILTLDSTGIIPDGAEYVFSAWRESGTGNYYYPGDEFTFEASKTLTAIWSPAEGYTVTYQAGTGGSGDDYADSGLSFGTYSVKSIDDVNIAAMEGYEFSHWADSTGQLVGSELFLTADVILTAQWVSEDESCYVIVYNSGEFGTGDPFHDDIGYGEEYNIFTIGESGFTAVDGYVFSHWISENNVIYDGGETITAIEDVFLTAVWVQEIAGYTVTYLDNIEGADVYSDSAAGTYVIQTPEDIGLTNEFYSVSHWIDVTNGIGSSYASGETITVESDLVLAPVWVSVCHRVYYFNDVSDADLIGDLNAIEKLSVATNKTFQLEHDAAYTVYTPEEALVSNEGYEFLYWVDQDENIIYPEQTITIDKIETYLYAVWDDDFGNVEVTFNAGLGEFESGHPTSSVLVNSGSWLEEPVAPENGDYELIAWVTEDDRIWEFDKFIVQEPDFTLDAVWKDDETEWLTITFDAAGGTFVLANTGNELDSYSIMIPMDSVISEPAEFSIESFGYRAPEGATLTNWVDSDGVSWDFGEPAVQSMDLSAVWDYEEGDEIDDKQGEDEQEEDEDEQEESGTKSRRIFSSSSTASSTASSTTSVVTPEVPESNLDETEEINDGFSQDLTASDDKAENSLFGLIRSVWSVILSLFG
ncbi:hypothetical protein MmiHf6_10440 [Methanimicrococcus hongohii]|uniref:Uncharacterized protein n=1 Tax=Methanimicrococcus hongohii TaxID=3028295 RepID=A0AA96V1P7_9EURY|nr:InlB B-repeat-containing protein [Methanimicrococcus sp. Hf6]WNY23730.1 hypothetical protein MmiHf6_10440 [Methanimicrococcus sp. Hf6]